MDRRLVVGFSVCMMMLVFVAIFAYQHKHNGNAITSPATSSAYTTGVGTTANSTSTIESSTQGKNGIKHVIIIVLENTEYGNLIGNTGAPYENSLAKEYSLLTDYFAVTHPSEPNYIAMIAGSTLNITNDGSVSENQKSATSIIDLLKTKNISWKAYEESMPTPCDTNNSADGLYVTKHDPFVYMTNITNNGSYCDAHVVNFTNFYKDLSNNQLPQYSFITPNINNDGHDTGMAFADKWLSTFLPDIINSSSFQYSVIFLTYDEGTTSLGGGGHVATIVIGPPSIVKHGFYSAVNYSHYSLLATVESIYGLGNLGRQDANATVINSVFLPGSG